VFTRIRRAVERRIARQIRHVVGQARLHTTSVRGHQITLDIESEIEEFRANTYAMKEPETLEWIERYFQPGDVMYDVGANIGLYSLFAAIHLERQCKIFAFEPEALNYAKLNANIHLNGLSGVIMPCCLALADQLCFDTFYLNPDNFEKIVAGQRLAAGSALHSFGIAEDYNSAEFQPFHVQGMIGAPLDYLWQKWGLDFPNHVKIDVDGLEEKIIAGAAQTLADRRLKSVLLEVSGKEGYANPILQKLREVGFTQVTEFAAHSSELLKGTPYEDSVNTIFIREF